MLKVLLKKQFAEVFKSYFYDAKKNRMRSKGAIIGWFVFFIVVMVGMLGGIFTSMALSLCGPLHEAGMGWLYFLLTSGIAVLLGAFGSVFNTYAGLYLAKDNDLLLSMPIPVRIILTARLLNVYLMGALYASVVLFPALVVSWIVVGFSLARVVCGLVLLLIVTVIVLLLSCLLGWVVARISLKLKNKSFIAVLVSLLFLGGYYFVYFRANALIQNLVANAQTYGDKIKGAAYILYLFGRIGEGSWLSTVIFLAVAAVLFALVWLVLSRSFLRIATSSGAGTGKARYVERTAKEKTAFRALLAKEFARFTSSPNYMLNCGFGILMIPVAGVALLLKGKMICDAVNGALTGRPDSAAVLISIMLCLLTSMIDPAAPSVSLEGRSLWIAQSLPIQPKTVLRAKAAMQLILTEIPMLFAGICAAIIIPSSASVKVMVCVTPLVYGVFSALFNMVIGVRMPLLNWTNEIVPIKQSGSVMIALIGGWGIAVVPGGLYLLVGYHIGAAAYLLICTILFAVLSACMLRWLDRKGSRIFSALAA